MLTLGKWSISGDQLACLLVTEHVFWEQHLTRRSASFRHLLRQGPSGPTLHPGGHQRLWSVHGFFAGVWRRYMGGLNVA